MGTNLSVFFIMHGEVYILFGIKVISRLIGLTYENIAKMAKFSTFRNTYSPHEIDIKFYLYVM